jgi:hypothetical protein
MKDEWPDDENGDALRNMEMSGDDLGKSRDIDFSVIFRSASKAQEFCSMISKDNMRVDCHRSEGNPDVWDVTVTSNMVPTHNAISLMEDRLARLAAPFGGQNDGWGCFAVPRQ